MKTISKYCQAVLFPLLLSSPFIAAAESTHSTEQIIDQTEQGKFIWADLYTGNTSASLDFYTKTFGWTAKKLGDENGRYHLLYDGNHPVAGVISRHSSRSKTENALWIGSITTPNMQANVDKAALENATIILQPHDFELYGKRSVIADPQGGVIALLDSEVNNKIRQKITQKWVWAQLFSVDPKKAGAFYQSVFNYSVEEVTPQESSLYLVQQDEIRASIVKLPASLEQRDRWVNFIEVEDLAVTLAAAEKNGAKIIYQPEGDSTAIIADPNGALLGLTAQESE